MVRKPHQLIATLGAVAGLAIALAPAASANPPTLIGGLDLYGYCQSQGYASVTLIKGTNYGPNYAYDNWRCVGSSGATHPFSMEQACKSQYQVEAILAQPTDPNDAYSWNCYAPGSHPR